MSSTTRIIIMMRRIICQGLMLVIFASPLCSQSLHIMGSTDFPINDNSSSEENGLGKVLSFTRFSASTVYACSAAGGIFVSVDNGTTWRSLTGSFLPCVNMGCVALSLHDSTILYAGTGEVSYAETYGWGGYGVFKSTDGGQHWTVSNTGMGNTAVMDIIMNQSNTSELVACCEDGMYRTTDAGATWTRTFTSPVWMQQCAQRGQSDTIFAVSNNSFLTSVDWGNTWRSVDLDPTNSSVFTTGRLGVAQSNDNIVYVSWIIDSVWGYADEAEVFRSTDGGNTFTKVHDRFDSPSLGSYDGTDASGGYSWANYCLTVDPTDANTIYTGSHLIYQSTDGGNTYTPTFPNWWCCIHTDIHDISIDPANNSRMLCANDGGVFVSTDQGSTWTPSGDGLDCSEYMSFGQSHIDSTYVVGGLQDNGIIYLNDDGLDHTYGGGDYFNFILCDYFNAHNSYTSQGTGQVFDPYNRGNTASLNLPADLQGLDDPNMEFSQLHASRAVAWNQDLWVTSNLDQYTMGGSGGTSSISWAQLTSLTNETILALAISPVNDDLIYFITDSSLLYTCTLSGGALQSLTSQALPSPANVTASIAISTLNPNVIYIVCNNQVYRSADGGQFWTNFTDAALPNINFTSIYVDPYSSIEAQYLITDIGVYYHGWGFPDWTWMDPGFPSDLQNPTANYYQVIVGSGLYKGSNSATSHVSMGTWGAGLQQASFYDQRCGSLPAGVGMWSFGASFPTHTACYDTTFGADICTITSNGASIGGSADQFTMLGGLFTRSGSVTVHVTSVSQGDTTQPCEAGLMIRDYRGGNSPAFVMVAVNGNGQLFMRSRATAGAGVAIIPIATPNVPYPLDLRLVLSADTVYMLTQYDTASAWINSGYVLVSMSDSVYAGVVTTSGSNGIVNTTAVSVPDFTGFNLISTGIQSVAAGQVSIYPDPAQDHISVRLPVQTEVGYQVSDILGKGLLTGGFMASQAESAIDISALSPGNYIVRFTDKEQNIIGVGRFIKM